MKQIIQDLKSGATILEEVPAPKVKRGHVLIKTTKSLVSLGTERMLVEFGKANLIQKARKQPDKVKMVLDKIRAEGLMPTLETVFNKLGQPLPLGYCNVGKVIGVGKGVEGFKVGDRVASNGQHAEFVCVPKNLVAHIPDNISDNEAAFTVIGSIGLQGIRLLKPTIGETIVVVGLGLIGLITAELLKANGCRVIGIDLDDSKLKIAEAKGIITVNPRNGTDPVQFVETITNGIGADGVIITASAKSDDIISQAAHMSRKRGRIILVGVIGLNISRADFYEKELTFQVSCSYGPGRYDDNYEYHGNDYPLPFVRWTENRNFDTVLYSIASGNLDVKPLISEVVELKDYLEIYGDIGSKRTIASLISYPADSKPNSVVKLNTKSFQNKKGVIGIIGAGNFAKMTVLPAFKGIDADIKYIASSGGVSGTALAKKHGIANSTSDYKEIVKDSEVDTLIITTRHNLHASMTIEGLKADKNVFVEKPLALNEEELTDIINTYEANNGTVTVGFNRRFSPHIQKMKTLIGGKDIPKNIVATMNAGFIPQNVWVHDLEVGGGRIIGEACHYIDLISYLADSKVVSICMNSMGTNPAENTDNASILLKYENGTNGVINYFANGNKAYSKERVEVYEQQKVLIMDNFRTLKGYGYNGFSSMSTKLNKVHKKQFELLTERIKSGGEPLIPFDSLVNTTKASFAAIESLKTGNWVEIN
jgi:predicted dehydrogenase/threonine dehydrogenase-like Zn-dependent dehydrogenase